MINKVLINIRSIKNTDKEGEQSHHQNFYKKIKGSLSSLFDMIDLKKYKDGVEGPLHLSINKFFYISNLLSVICFVLEYWVGIWLDNGKAT